MTDRLQPEPSARPVAPERPKTWWSLSPEDLGVHPAAHGQIPLIVRDHDVDLSVLVTTKMMSHGFEAGRLRTLVVASSYLRALAASANIEEQAGVNSLAAGEDVARFLLRTAGESSGIPCSTSGVLHGLSPTPAPISMVLTDGQHRLSMLEPAVRLATGSGKTRVLFDLLVARLTTRLDDVGRDGRLTAVEAKHIADAAYALSALLLDLAKHLRHNCVKFFGHLVGLPATECSPCGVLRLAAPRVPRAPGAGPVPGPTEFALAA